MKRPIAADNGAVTWKKDELAESWFILAVSKDLHRYAGKRHRLSCLPKRSSIDGGYYAEIALAETRSDGVYMKHNIAMGTGPDPVTAAARGYRLAAPDDPIWSAFLMEAEVERLRRTVKSAKSLEARLTTALDGLTAMIRSVNVPRAADPGEDDDL